MGNLFDNDGNLRPGINTIIKYQDFLSCISKLEFLNPDKFVNEKHCNVSSIEIDSYSIFNFNSFEFNNQKSFELIGYSFSKNTMFHHRDRDIVFMAVDLREGNEFWFHGYIGNIYGLWEKDNFPLKSSDKELKELDTSKEIEEPDEFIPWRGE